MQIAMIGTRGIPASYSGFETAVEQLSKRLVARGHAVTVYCRTTHVSYTGSTYLGVRLVKLPTIPSKHFDTIFHTLFSILHLLFSRAEVVFVCGVGNSAIAWIPRLFGKKVVINVDGADWERDKWGRFAKWFLKTSERWATRTSNAIVADSRKVQEYYETCYQAKSTFIPYGADMPTPVGIETLGKYQLTSRGYILFVGRLVPENNAHELVAAFRSLQTDKKLVIVGDAPYAEDYIRGLKQAASEQIVFTGYLFGEGYRELSAHAAVYVLASSVGGTHPVLVEQMAMGNAILVNGIPTNRETIGNAGRVYETAGGSHALAQALQAMLDHPEECAHLGKAAKARAAAYYSWETVTAAYENLFQAVLQKEQRP